MKKRAFIYSEGRLAKILNCSRGDLRYLRDLHLVEGFDYERNAGEEILLSYDGLAKLVKLMGAKVSEIDLGACVHVEKKTVGAAPEKNGALKMTITKIPFNPRMVLARFPNEEDEHLVDVGRNATFALGDLIEVADHEVASGVYQLLSPIPRDRRRPWLLT
jgi:hypothetical protein